MKNEIEQKVELLSPEEAALPVLRVTEPMSRLREIFGAIVATKKTALVWAEKLVVDSPQTRDDARNVRKELYDAKKKLDKYRLLLLKPLDDFRDEFGQMCKELLVDVENGIKVIDEKGVAYAEQCQRDEREAKRRADAELEEARKKKEAAERDREAKEQQIRLEEERKLKAIEDKKIADANAEGRAETDQVEADVAVMEAQAQMDKDRAERERKQKEEDAKAEADFQAAQSKNIGAMAKAKTPTKGVKSVWVIEIENEAEIPAQFKTYDPKKARGFLAAGLATTEDPLKIIPGLRCYKALTSTGG